LLPSSIGLYVLAWNLLKGMKPKNYKSCKNIWNGFVWHFFKPRTKKGLDLISNMKDLVRGTIYSDIEKVIEAYKFFKSTPGVEIIDIKEKIVKLRNVTVNFIFNR